MTRSHILFVAMLVLLAGCPSLDEAGLGGDNTTPTETATYGETDVGAHWSLEFESWNVRKTADGYRTTGQLGLMGGRYGHLTGVKIQIRDANRTLLVEVPLGNFTLEQYRREFVANTSTKPIHIVPRVDEVESDYDEWEGSVQALNLSSGDHMLEWLSRNEYMY